MLVNAWCVLSTSRLQTSTFYKRKNWAKAESTGMKLTLNKLFWGKHMKININKNISTP